MAKSTACKQLGSCLAAHAQPICQQHKQCIYAETVHHQNTSANATSTTPPPPPLSPDAQMLAEQAGPSGAQAPHGANQPLPGSSYARRAHTHLGQLRQLQTTQGHMGLWHWWPSQIHCRRKSYVYLLETFPFAYHCHHCHQELESVLVCA